MNSSVSGSPARTRFTLADFGRMGERYGFQYDMPDTCDKRLSPEQICLMEGFIQEYTLPSGPVLITSDVIARHRYAATSLSPPGFSLAVLLQGSAITRLENGDDIYIRPGAAMGALCHDNIPMTAIHPGGQRLRGLNLSLGAPETLADDQLSEALSRHMRSNRPHLRNWQVPVPLAQNIDQLFEAQWQGALGQLIREGISLQLLAHALSAFDDQERNTTAVTARDRLLLKRVSDYLYQAPGEDHSLAQLAKLACMSSTSLRNKFRAVYHMSVFEWLRERRLEVAREGLLDGWSVQQAAHYVGYRHATNFTTAFRQKFGLSPRELMRQPERAWYKH